MLTNDMFLICNMVQNVLTVLKSLWYASSLEVLSKSWLFGKMYLLLNKLGLTENCFLFLAAVEDDDGDWDDDWDDQPVDAYHGNEEAGASGQSSHGPSVMISLNK